MTACAVCEASTDGFACRPCVAEVERAIGDMPSLMHEVSVVATKQARTYRASTPATPDLELAELEEEYAWRVNALPARLRSPGGRVTLPRTADMVNLDARELLWDAWNTLGTWARHLAESRGVEAPTSEALVGWLLTYVESIRFDEAAAQIHDEITYLHRRMVSAVDRYPSRTYAGPCHAVSDSGRCEASLFAWPGADEVECDGWRPPSGSNVPVGAGCGAVHTVEARREWLIDELRGALVGVDELLAAVPRLFPDAPRPPRSVVRAWVRQGRLVPHGLSVSGEDLFVGADVLELIWAYRPHRYAPRTRGAA